MLKAFPSYKLLVQGANGAITEVSLPFTTQISTTREIQNSPAEANVTIYNLNMNNRENLYFDRYNFAGYRSFELYLGYGNDLSLVFKGNVMECYSVRSGVNFETHINAWDGGMFYISGFNSKTYNNTKVSDQIKSLMDEVKNGFVELGKMSPKIDENTSDISRPQSYFGKTTDIIKNIVGKAFDVFTENEEMKIVKKDEVISNGNITKISAKTGLLETPRKQEYTLEVTMMLEPKIQIGQAVELESVTAPRFNGTYKVIGVDHNALISENESSENTTTVILLYNSKYEKI